MCVELIHHTSSFIEMNLYSTSESVVCSAFFRLGHHVDTPSFSLNVPLVERFDVAFYTRSFSIIVLIYIAGVEFSLLDSLEEWPIADDGPSAILSGDFRLAERYIKLWHNAR